MSDDWGNDPVAGTVSAKPQQKAKADDWGDDPIAGKVDSQFAAHMNGQQPQADPWWKRFGTGVKDVAVAAGQIGAHLGGTSAEAPFVDQDDISAARKDRTAQVDQQVTDREKKIEGERAAAGQTGTDWWRVGGNIAGTLPLAAASPIVAGAASGALTPVADGNFAVEKAKQVGIGAVAGKAGEIGGNMLARALTPEASAVARAAEANPLLKQAREAGYVVHPAEATAEPGVAANTLAAFGGKIKTQQAASVKNQEVTNSIAAKELGLASDAPLTEGAFDAVRKEANKAYQAVKDAFPERPDFYMKDGVKIWQDQHKLELGNQYRSAIGEMQDRFTKLADDVPALGKQKVEAFLSEAKRTKDLSLDQVIEASKQLRFDAKENLKALGDPEKRALGLAQRQVATLLEDSTEESLAKMGKPGLVDNFRKARTLIAKSHDIEMATDAAGNVDAHKIAAMADKGKPLTGGLKTIADTASAFRKSMQNPSKFGGNEKLSVLDMGSMIAGGSAAISSGHPALALAALAPLARPLARTAALSEGIQNRLAGLNAKPMLGLDAIPLNGRNQLAALIRAGGSAPAPALGSGANALIGP